MKKGKIFFWLMLIIGFFALLCYFFTPNDRLGGGFVFPFAIAWWIWWKQSGMRKDQFWFYMMLGIATYGLFTHILGENNAGAFVFPGAIAWLIWRKNHWKEQYQ